MQEALTLFGTMGIEKRDHVTLLGDCFKVVFAVVTVTEFTEDYADISHSLPCMQGWVRYLGTTIHFI